MRIIALLFAVLLSSLSAHASTETRGLTVVAKDNATNQTGEVKLYNKSYAVIIGIDKYQDRSIKPLKNAVNDAKGIKRTLDKMYRFNEITTLYDAEATKQRIMELFQDELAAKVTEDDAVFVFWASHGTEQGSSRYGELGYLIPYDGSMTRHSRNISMETLKTEISKTLKARHVFYVMDACYGGLMTDKRAFNQPIIRDLATMKKLAREDVRQVLTAGSKGEEVLDGINGHSVFTWRLIEALEQAGDFITANEIQAIITRHVTSDALKLNHSQTPQYGKLYGQGDFVFVQNIEQKVADGAAVLEKIASERKALESQIADASKANDEQKRREAERQKEILIARQKFEEDKQKLLADEKRRIEEQVVRQREFEAEQKRKHEELVRQTEQEKRELEKLKGKVGALPAGQTSTLAAAVAEIRKLSAEIDALEAEITSEQAAAKRRITERYDTLIADLKSQRRAAESNRPVKDRFETEVEFRERLRTHLSGYDSRLAELERQKTTALTEADSSLETARVSRTNGLKQEIKSLSMREYPVDPATLVVDLGEYDAEKQQFQVSIRNRVVSAPVDSKDKKKPNNAMATPRQEPSLVKIAMNGTLSLPKRDARLFDNVYRNRPALIRPEITARPNGDIVKVAIVNEAENYIMEYANGEFITMAEKKRRQEEEQRRLAAERELIRVVELERQAVGKMVIVPGGCFTANSKQTCLDSFHIGRYEVTQGQFKRIMGSNPSKFSSCGDDCPVEQVSWDDAQLFISRLNNQTGKRFRLPTEAEWEYACRSGGKNEKYCGGDSIDTVAWYSGNSESRPHPVGQKQPNGLGIYDMSGNVYEWVQEWYNTGYTRVARGGSWLTSAETARAAARRSNSPDGDFFVGFRLAVSEPRVGN